MKHKSSDNVGAFFSAYLWLTDGSYPHFQRNSQLLDRAGVPLGRRIYVSRLTPTVIALLSRDELDRIKKDSSFFDWSVYEYDEPTKGSDAVILEQIGADVTNGTNSPLFNDGMGYSGSGVKVGVISAENLIYNADAFSLLGVNVTVLPSILPPKKDSHPTAVISEISGRKALKRSNNCSSKNAMIDSFHMNVQGTGRMFWMQRRNPLAKQGRVPNEK